MKRTGRLRARSKKTAALYIVRRRLVAELHAANPICEVPWCSRPSTDPHEPLTRARGGSILDRTNVRMVCRPCHDEILAQEGMDTAVNAADLKFVQLARWWIEQWSAQRKTFTADDLLLALDSLGVATRENRALGGVVRTAHRDGLIAATGRYVPSTRAVSHARPNREWRGTGRGSADA